MYYFISAMNLSLVMDRIYIVNDSFSNNGDYSLYFIYCST